MTATAILRRAALALALCTSGAAIAQPTSAPSTYTPSVGQEGKDVVWVPTPQSLVDRMLDLAQVTASDYVMDLGSGDGRTVITAAKRGARAHGIEYNAEMVALSKRAAEQEGVAGKATFVRADLFASDFSQASVITMFLLPSINLKLRPKILNLKPGTRVVSNSFTMGDWTPDQTDTLDSSTDCKSWCTAHLWIVPAKVGGTWKLPQGELHLQQQFQMLTGTLRSAGKSLPIDGGKVRGDEIVFTAGGLEYKGKINGKRIDGGNWSATRS